MLFRATFVCLLLIAAIASAQLTITANDLPTAGYEYARGMQGQATFNVGSAGAAQSWEFMNTVVDNITTTTYMDPAETPFAASFPTATIVAREVSADLANYLYYRITGSEDRLLGFAMPGMDSATHYAAEVLLTPLPVTYNTSWTMVARIEMGPGVVLLDSVECTVDGWGTITTPYGTQNVLRAFSRHWMMVGTTASTMLGYAWNNQNGISVVSLLSEPNETDPNFTTGALTMSGLPLAAEPVRGPVAEVFAVGQNYPNPFNPTTTLPVELAQTARVQFDIYDETGRQVSSRSYELPAGQHTLPVDGSGWATGTYFARVNANGLSQTTKMQLVK